MIKKATRQHTKEHNRTLILNIIYNSSTISRAELARLTKLTPTTVSEISADLIADGLVAEVGFSQSAGGKPATLLSFINDARCILGIDLANNQFRGAVINLRGKVHYFHCIPVQETTRQVALALVYQMIDELLRHAPAPILGIGIGTPGLINVEEGVVRRAVNLDWQDLPLRSLLETSYNIPVHIANDSQAAALGEFIFGGEEQKQNLVLIKVGRGIGSGIVLNQQLYFGDGFGAGEIGHVVVGENGELCRCGHTGCLETWASERAIVRRARALHLHPTSANPDELTFDDVVAAYQAGDPEVITLIRETGHILGGAAAYFASILNIQQIVLSGNITAFGAGITAPMQEEMSRRALPALAGETRITISSLEQDIVMLGTAAMILHNELHLV